MRDLTMTGTGIGGEEITVSAPTISGLVAAFREQERLAADVREMLAVPTEPECIEFCPKCVFGKGEHERAQLAAMIDLDERAPWVVPAMTPAMRRPNVEPAFVDEVIS